MIEFKVGFEFFDFQSPAEFSLKDGPEPQRVAGFRNEDQGLDRREGLVSRDSVGQLFLVFCSNNDHLGCGDRGGDLFLQLQLMVRSALMSGEHQEGFGSGNLHGSLPLF